MATKDIEWTVERENILFKAMSGKRPVSFVAHFSMASILKIFNTESGLNVSSEVIWAKLNSMYNMDLINQKQLRELPRLFRERKDFDLSTHPQFKGKIEPLKISAYTISKEQVKADVPLVVEKSSPVKFIEKPVVRKPSKPEVPVSVPTPVVVKKPRKLREVTPKSAYVLNPIKPSSETGKTFPKFAIVPKSSIIPKPATISKPASTPNPSTTQKVDTSISKTVTVQKKTRSKNRQAVLNLITIPAKPIHVPDTNPKERGRKGKKPTLPEAQSPPSPSPAKKRRYKVTITK